MVLSKKQVQLVQDSWAALGSDWRAIGLGIFNKAFELEPGLKKLFVKLLTAPNPDQALGDHVSRVIERFDIAISQLQHPDQMSEDLHELGTRHPGYGVVGSKHKAPVGAAVIHYLETHCGSKWNNETKAAWAKTWDMVMNSMGIHD